MMYHDFLEKISSNNPGDGYGDAKIIIHTANGAY